MVNYLKDNIFKKLKHLSAPFLVNEKPQKRRIADELDIIAEEEGGDVEMLDEKSSVV